MTVLQWCQIADAVSEAKARCARPRAVRQQVQSAALQMAVGAPVRQPSAPTSFIRDLGVHAKPGADAGDEDTASDEQLADTLVKLLTALGAALAPPREQRARYQLTKDELTREEADRVLFPLAIYFDQLIASRPDARLAPREASGLFDAPALVQDTLFHIDDGGERFYLMLEEALNEREPPSLLLEVYYYCLKDGFLGRYNADSPERTSLLERLAQRLDDSALPRFSVAVPPAGATDRAAFPLRYYLKAAAGMLAVFLTLSAASEIEVWLVRTHLHSYDTTGTTRIGPLNEVRSLHEVASAYANKPCIESGVNDGK
jgi:type IV/VI secretion system ImpK/VasF family protein